MAQFDAGMLAIVKRLQNARLSLLQKHPFYALLLMYMKFSIDLTCETAYTDGNRIAFNPEFMQNLSDSELEFVLMHEVLHTALGHPFRHQQDYDQQAFDIACDIVVNSNILHTEVSYEAFPLEYIVIGIEGLELSSNENNDGRFCVFAFPESVIRLYFNTDN